MANILVVCATKSGETLNIGNLIGEGIRMSGHEAQVVKVNDIKNENDLMEYNALILGSPTYHGDMLEGMKRILFLGEKAGLDGKPGGAFGAFGWSAEAPDRIFQTMANIFKMEMVSGPLMLKSSKLTGGIKMAQDYGREVVAKL